MKKKNKLKKVKPKKVKLLNEGTDKKKVNPNLFTTILSIYWVLFCMISPFIICGLPVIPYIITDNAYWMWGMFITFPLGLAIGLKFLEPEFMFKSI